MSLINVQNLTFCYDGSCDNIFENVSFMIDTDWKLGFVGRNGRGKTTFFNLLMGKFEYSGTISSSVSFDYFPFEVEDKSLNTIDVVESIVGEFEEWVLYRELNLLNVDLDCLFRPFNLLSEGEQNKVKLATLFLKNNNFLLLDEPTNHLDSHAREIVSNYLSRKKSFILISHDRAFLDGCVDHILSINRANIELQRGNFSSWYQNKSRQDEFELLQNKKLKDEIDRLKQASKRKSDWSDKAEKAKIGNGPCDRGFIGAKSAKVMKTAKALENRQNQAIEEKSGLLKNVESNVPLKVVPLTHYAQRLILARDFGVCYDGRVVFEGVNFELMQGERVAIVGKNGCGKSSVIRAISATLDGKNQPKNMEILGKIELASGLKMSFVSQDTSHLSGNIRDFAVKNGIDETLFRSILAKLDFNRTQMERDLGELSSGQKKKILIASSLSESANLYVWDEPLNYIDVISRMQIEDVILQYCPTLLFVEHDTTFLSKIATKTIDISKIDQK